MYYQPKRSLSGHQKQMRFFTFVIGLLLVVGFATFIYLINR
jgi:hypothetical protein